MVKLSWFRGGAVSMVDLLHFHLFFFVFFVRMECFEKMEYAVKAVGFFRDS